MVHSILVVGSERTEQVVIKSMSYSEINRIYYDGAIPVSRVDPGVFSEHSLDEAVDVLVVAEHSASYQDMKGGQDVFMAPYVNKRDRERSLEILAQGKNRFIVAEPDFNPARMQEAFDLGAYGCIVASEDPLILARNRKTIESVLDPTLTLPEDSSDHRADKLMRSLGPFP